MSDPQSSLPDSCIFSTWNIQGRILERFNLWLEGARTEVLDILALQEVAGLHLISGHDGAAGLKLRSFDDALWGSKRMQIPSSLVILFLVPIN